MGRGKAPGSLTAGEESRPPALQDHHRRSKMILYLDTSALVKLYIAESGSGLKSAAEAEGLSVE
jgi:hypothetical protein